MHFHHFDAEGYVSIWVGVFLSKDVADRHMRERYGDRHDNEPLAEWMGEFGFSWFDHDFMETIGEVQISRPIQDLLARSSYSESFLHEAIREAEREGIAETHCVVLLYDFRYDPAVTGVRQGTYLRFLGTFPFAVEAGG